MAQIRQPYSKSGKKMTSLDLLDVAPGAGVASRVVKKVAGKKAAGGVARGVGKQLRRHTDKPLISREARDSGRAAANRPSSREAVDKMKAEIEKKHRDKLGKKTPLDNKPVDPKSTNLGAYDNRPSYHSPAKTTGSSGVSGIPASRQHRYGK